MRNKLLFFICLILICACSKKVIKNVAAKEENVIVKMHENWSKKEKGIEVQIDEIEEIDGKIEKANQLYALTLSNFIKVGHNDSRVPELMLWKGNFYLKEGLLNESITSFTELVENYPNSIQANKAMKNLAIAHNKSGNYDDSEYWYKQIDKKEKVMSDENRTVNAKNQYAMAENILKEGKDFLAAEKFYQIYVNFKDINIGRIALFRVGDIYAKNKDCNKAISVFKEFRNHYGNDKRMPQILFEEAICWEGLNAHDRAIQGFLKLIGAYPNSEFSETGLLRVALNFEKSGKWKLSARVQKRFVEIYPNSEKICDFLNRDDVIENYKGLKSDFKHVNNKYNQICYSEQ